jgi:hypothetical protein
VRRVNGKGNLEWISVKGIDLECGMVAEVHTITIRCVLVAQVRFENFKSNVEISGKGNAAFAIAAV